MQRASSGGKFCARAASLISQQLRGRRRPVLRKRAAFACCVGNRDLRCRLVLATPTGFEPVTPRLGIWCSIQLSYGAFGRHQASRHAPQSLRIPHLEAHCSHAGEARPPARCAKSGWASGHFRHFEDRARVGARKNPPAARQKISPAEAGLEDEFGYATPPRWQENYGAVGSPASI
jgi:hypothetical protein